MTIQKEKANTANGAEFSEKKLLKFTCPECGSHRLEEVVLMRQEIEGFLEPEDPEYNWIYEGDDLVVFRDTPPVYTLPWDYNYYRCFQCDAELENEDGEHFW
jgi:DNA-directed RNA polymerase subunit RPC12/RpoP